MDVTARVRNPIFEKYLQKSTSTLRNSDEICTNRMAILGIKTIKPLIYNNSQSFYIGIANLVFVQRKSILLQRDIAPSTTSRGPIGRILPGLWPPERWPFFCRTPPENRITRPQAVPFAWER
jgi:hypothetical protein